LAAFSSLRPLLVSSGSATRATREHRIFYDAHGVLRITGGKFTTYRAMSEEAADLVANAIAPALAKVRPTSTTPLNGNSAEAIALLIADAPMLAARHSVDAAEIILLIHQYGLLTPAVLSYLPERPGAALDRLELGRLKYAVRHEMVRRPSDFLEVSTAFAHEGRALSLVDEDWRDSSA
jgi:glycerol-3-phosphate dehydrogenase